MTVDDIEVALRAVCKPTSNYSQFSEKLIAWNCASQDYVTWLIRYVRDMEDQVDQLKLDIEAKK